MASPPGRISGSCSLRGLVLSAWRPSSELHFPRGAAGERGKWARRDGVYLGEVRRAPRGSTGRVVSRPIRGRAAEGPAGLQFPGRSGRTRGRAAVSGRGVRTRAGRAVGGRRQRLLLRPRAQVRPRGGAMGGASGGPALWGRSRAAERAISGRSGLWGQGSGSGLGDPGRVRGEGWKVSSACRYAAGRGITAPSIPCRPPRVWGLLVPKSRHAEVHRSCLHPYARLCRCLGV